MVSYKIYLSHLSYKGKTEITSGKVPEGGLDAGDF